MNRRTIVGLLCLTFLLLLSTRISAKIIFSSERNGVRGIYVMDDDGSNQTLLIESEILRPYPTGWSPDGKQIAFGTGTSLFLMNRDGTNVRELVKNTRGGSINGGRFSPDGKFIVFNKSVQIKDELKVGIYKLNIKTGKTEEISDVDGIQCDWSPDGKQIIFAKPIAVLGGGGTIWIMESDKDNPRPLIHDPGLQVDNFVIQRSRPRWSPDGQQIVFIEMEHKWQFVPDVGHMRFFRAFRCIICNRNGKNIKQLQIPKDWECISIDWMDDGESIVFIASAGIPVDRLLPVGFEWPPRYIYKYHIKTHEITQLTDDPSRDAMIDWISDDVLPVSPKGKQKVTLGELKQ